MPCHDLIPHQPKFSDFSGEEELLIFAGHTDDLRQALKSKLGSMVTALNMHFGTAAEFRVPPGGMFIWVRFPAQVDTARLVQPCLDEGVAFNPGSEWSTEPSAAKNCIRLCFAHPSEPEIHEGIAPGRGLST